MIAKILVALLSMSFVLSINDSLLANFQSQYSKFLLNINKTIQSPDEFNYRLNLYVAKKKEIDEFNSLNLSYQKGLNFFSDMTVEERFKFLGERDSNPESAPVVQRADSTDGNSEAGSMATGDSVLPTINNLNLSLIFPINFFNFVIPQKKDWASEGKVTPVKNQGSCGSCWAFAATAAVEAAYKMKHNLNLDLAEQELVDCSKQLGSNGCEGGFSQGGLEYFKAFGVRSESLYPYTAKNGVCKPRTSTGQKIKSYVAVAPRNMLSYINNLKLQPMTTSFYVVNSFFDYKNGVYNADKECTNLESKGTNHAVLAVGYDLTSPNPFIKLKNSWGVNWGENGFFRISMKKTITQDGPCNLIKKDRTFYPVL